MEEMEKRSDRHIRDLVAHTAFKGLDANEIGCARISVMAGSNCSLQRAECSSREQASAPAEPVLSSLCRLAVSQGVMRGRGKIGRGDATLRGADRRVSGDLNKPGKLRRV
jgi:hypothetical protein